MVCRARCGDCGHDYFVALSRKGRGVCPRAPPGAWWRQQRTRTITSSPPAGAPVGALRAQEVAVLHATRRSGAEHGAAHLLRVIAQTLQTHSPGAAHMDKAGLHIGAIAFIHRFGSSLNEHVHFHVCVVDGCLRKWRARAMLMRPSNLIAGCHLSRGHRHRCGYRGPSADPLCKTHPARLRCSGPAGEL